MLVTVANTLTNVTLTVQCFGQCVFYILTFTAPSTPSLINKQTGIKRQQRCHYTAAVAFPSLPVCDDPHYHQRVSHAYSLTVMSSMKSVHLSGSESNESSNSIFRHVFQSLEEYQHKYYIFHNHIKYNTLMPKLCTFSVRFISLWVRKKFTYQNNSECTFKLGYRVKCHLNITWK